MIGDIMNRIIAFANQKGGVGKTTTCVNMATFMALMGKKVLLVDLDPQGNATSNLGFTKDGSYNSIYQVMSEQKPVTDAIYETKVQNLSIIPANIDLAGVEVELVYMNSREYVIRKIFEQVKNSYDYITIDCPPSLGLLTINAFTASDAVIIPIQCEFFALEGLSQLMNTIRLVKKKLNPEISIDFRYYTPDWNYDLAYKKMNSLLDSGLIPDAVICGNDAVAESIIRSISEHMVEKAIPVSGQDAEISACRRVVKGTQSATVYKPIDDLAKKASEFAVLLGSKKTIPEDLSEQTVFNGSKDVPVYWLEPALVTSSNINEVIIEPGFHTKKEIYR